MIYLSGEEALEFQTENTAIALGKFDGIHLGHQLLIDGLMKEKEKGKKALVFTFGEPPKEVLSGVVQKRIYTAEEKAYYFAKLGIDILLEFPFTKEFASLDPELFVRRYLTNRLGVQSVYIGDDYRFGRGRTGNVALMRELGAQYHFEVHAIPKKSLHGKVVSSTVIRDMLESHFSVANELLGNPYFVYDTVVHGKHLGHEIGFPTINQVISAGKLTPAYGVYASRIMVGGKYYDAVSNLGVKPTIEGKHQVGLETHILDYSGDLYDQKVKVDLLCYLRPEERFKNVEELTRQIKIDIQNAKEHN